MSRLEVVEWLASDGFGFVVVGTWVAVGLYYLAGPFRRARRVLSDVTARVDPAPPGDGDRRPSPPGKDTAP